MRGENCSQKPVSQLDDPGSPQRSIPKPSSKYSAKPTNTTELQSPRSGSPVRIQPRSTSKPRNAPHQLDPTSPPQFDERYPDLLLQPESRPISLKKLASEVKSIYANLVMVENECRYIDHAQAAAVQDPNTKLPPDHWQALIALHRTLLHEHHDFFLASQHPSASPGLRRIAVKYFMPARMWKYGIHSFLELLRRSLPDSMDYMLAFIYLAYQILALLCETVPAFEDTWMECLGDLGRYRMAIENEDVRDRDTWAGVARSWYTKAADKNPIVGRLYHHLAILARPNALQQIYYYSRSFTSAEPFEAARESIRTLLDPVVDHNAASLPHALPIDISFMKPHALQFLGRSVKDDKASEEFLKAKTEFVDSLDSYISRVKAEWKDQGVWVAVTNIAGWFGYVMGSNILHQAFLIDLENKEQNTSSTTVKDDIRATEISSQKKIPKPSIAFGRVIASMSCFMEQPVLQNAKALTHEVFIVALQRLGDENVLSHVNVMLAFTASIAFNEYTSDLVSDMPWTAIATFLNALVKTEIQARSQSHTQLGNIDTIITSSVFPDDGERVSELPLPEDYLTRGLIWTHGYFPKKWFDREHDEEKRYIEAARTARNRTNRVLRLGYALAEYNYWISYDNDTHKFRVLGPDDHRE
ncbi:hypothetical protein COCCADRAFT_112877 [Bipolaris zeicola 26-R-13]|uniref:DNA/RNA-binding domain-containing protein n=1 Tax=Cochliobolus carbonum (strain 26-R-13) TaxID=930089 RepID=W6XNA0_COCC2|nr:uncharacterized protein COCCADRAFT_112877 [Bipolaris zeicola 26-R-13]EUC26973.1 hypothetical protein COCCADRAFT_112877 [Bipolaris zeicola 26-R-13]